MVSIHGGDDISVKAGTTTLATSTGQYLACAWTADNTVAPIQTVTSFLAFAGFTQNYALSSGGDITLRTTGFTKARCAEASVTAGNLVGPYVNTTTGYGMCGVSVGKIADPTAGATYVYGVAAQGTQGGTNTIFELQIRPSAVTYITTTVATATA